MQPIAQISQTIMRDLGAIPRERFAERRLTQSSWIISGKLISRKKKNPTRRIKIERAFPCCAFIRRSENRFGSHRKKKTQLKSCIKRDCALVFQKMRERIRHQSSRSVIDKKVECTWEWGVLIDHSFLVSARPHKARSCIIYGWMDALRPHLESYVSSRPFIYFSRHCCE